MRVLGVCEGAREGSGGVGISAVPGIHEALARRGHRVGLAIAGQIIPSARHILTGRLEDALDSKEESAIAAVSFPAYGRWSFSPMMSAAIRNVANQTDFVAMHSLFSYPVLAGYSLARHFRKPYGVWLHGVLAPVQRNVSRVKKSLYYTLLGRRILNSASVLFFTAAGERDEAHDLGLTAPSVVIPHGTNILEFSDLPPVSEFRQKYLGGSEGPLVLFLGRLNAKKGLDLLAEAMARVQREVPGVKLAIAGSADPPAFLAEVQRWLRAAGLGDVAVLTGLLEDRDRLAAFAACDVFVMPSVAENFGCSMFEAMACGRAVVCSDAINYADEVRRWDAGLAVPRQAEALAGAITSLLRDPQRRTALGVNGLALANNYSWEANAEHVETAIRCVLARQPFPAELSPG